MNDMNVSPAFELNSKTIEPLSGTSKIYGSDTEDMFSTILDSAVNSLNTTNKYLSDAENEEIKLALGETENTHDLAIALQKASVSLQYTVAIRDKFLEAYKEIINMQI
ncbi:MAG: flagellar hook-basal body complex protein FliE [Lachnospiraceae bacterium]|nr:flagellar hook-basal body complex protein FliE [Lachnospiraceae bacterium]MBQ8262100.1 flagellar hook-basal body complex protein FliE [Lachnospiraceae bacterium]